MKKTFSLKFFFLLCIALCSLSNSSAQTDLLTNARKNYRLKHYKEALYIYRFRVPVSSLTDEDYLYLGDMYLNGLGTLANYEFALEYFTKSAREGNNKYAQLELGRMYLYGRGVEADGWKAHAWLSNACDQGLADAWYEMGMMYFKGLAGRKANVDHGANYLTEASRMGSSKAAQALKEYPFLDLRRKEITLTVYDDEGKLCSGASVSFPGEKITGAYTQQGIAKIKAKPGDRLKILYIGCKEKYLDITSDKSYTVWLKKK